MSQQLKSVTVQFAVVFPQDAFAWYCYHLDTRNNKYFDSVTDKIAKAEQTGNSSSIIYL